MKSYLDYYNLREETDPVPVKKEPDTVSLDINGTEYKLELVNTPEKIHKGMSGRKIIPRKTGMLFDLPVEMIQSFCMRDCECDMDLIYVNSKNKVVGLHRMKQEPRQTSKETKIQYNNRLKNYESDEPAKYAIEIPSGDITRLAIKNGQIIKIPK